MMGSSAKPLSSSPQMDAPHTALLYKSVRDRIGPSQQSRDFYLHQQEDVLKTPQSTGCHTNSQPHPHLATLTGELGLWSSYSSCKRADGHGMDIFIARGKKNAPPKS